MADKKTVTNKVILSLNTVGLELHQSVQATLNNSKTDETPSQVSAEDVAANITQSVSHLSRVANTIVLANRLGAHTGEKALEEAGHVIPILVDGIHQKNAPTENENFLLRLYAASHDNKVRPPLWFRNVRAIVNVDTQNTDLPSPEVYAKALSDKGVPAMQQAMASIQNAYNTYVTYKTSKDDQSKEFGQGGTKTEEARLKLEKAKAEIGQKLIAMKVDPATLQPCADRVSLHISLNPKEIDMLVSYHKTLGDLIEALLHDEPSKPLSDFALSQVSLKTQSKDSTRITGLELRPFSELSSLSKEDFDPVLSAILEAYIELREAVRSVYDAHLDAAPAKGRDGASLYNRLKNRLGGALNSVLPSHSKEIVSSLIDRDEPALASGIRGLLFSQVITRSEPEERALFVSSREQIEFLPEAMKAILDGDKFLSQQVGSDFSGFKSFYNFGENLRKVIQSEKHGDVAEFLDNALERCVAGSGRTRTGFEDQMSVFTALVVLSEDLQTMRILKAQLRNKDMVTELVEKLSDGISGKGSQEGQFIETQRAL